MIGVKSRGIQPVAHLVCELILWLCGLSLAIVWIIFTIPYSGDPAFKDFVIKWTDLFCFWSAVVLLMAMCQFALFVLVCIEVVRKRRVLKNDVNQTVQMIGDGGPNSGTLAQLDSTKPTWPVELPVMSTGPVEMHVEEHPMEMVGDPGAREMSVAAEDTNGNQMCCGNERAK